MTFGTIRKNETTISRWRKNEIQPPMKPYVNC